MGVQEQAATLSPLQETLLDRVEELHHLWENGRISEVHSLNPICTFECIP